MLSETTPAILKSDEREERPRAHQGQARKILLANCNRRKERNAQPCEVICPEIF